MRPRPKFCSGELVLIKGINGVRIHGPHEILTVEWASHKDFCVEGVLSSVSDYTGWNYGFPKNMYALERQIIKLPDEERTSWEDCKQLLNQPEVEPC